MGGEARRRRLAIGARNGDNRRIGGTSREFELSQNVDMLLRRLGKNGQRWFEPRTRDDRRRIADFIAPEHEFGARRQFRQKIRAPRFIGTIRCNNAFAQTVQKMRRRNPRAPKPKDGNAPM